MPRAKNLAGNKFGKLLVTPDVQSRYVRNRSRRFWRCICDCGKEVHVDSGNLSSGNSESCGVCCKGTHRASGTPTYRVWAVMLSRCRNNKDDGWYLYGGRGIRVCSRWFKFENFLKDMGERPSGKSIERKNTNGNYTRRNCKWATPREQAQNRRTTKLSFAKAAKIRKLFAEGIIKAEIARRFEVSFAAICCVIDGSRWVRS
jgi:hypothetical protein